MSEKHIEALREVRDHLSAAADHLDESRPTSARRRVALARGIVERELDSLAAANPTAAVGAQGSDGQTSGQSDAPRAFDAESIRRRDQLRACQAAYDFRTRLAGGRR